MLASCGISEGPSLLGSSSNSGGPKWTLKFQRVENPDCETSMTIKAVCINGGASISMPPLVTANYSLKCDFGDSIKISMTIGPDADGLNKLWDFKLNGVAVPNWDGWREDYPVSPVDHPITVDESHDGHLVYIETATSS